jgi:hypothetical protein
LHKVQEKVNIDEEIKKIERKDKKRKRDNSEEEEEQGDGMVRAIHRAEKITMKQRRVAASTKLRKSRSRSNSRSSSCDSSFEKPMT